MPATIKEEYMIERIHEAVQIIDESLAADNFNEEDRLELEKNRELFRSQVLDMQKIGGQLIKSTEIAA